MLGIAAGFVSVFPPISTFIATVEVPQLASIHLSFKTLVNLTLMTIAASSAYSLVYTLLARQRKKFALPTPCTIESSDPNEDPPDASGLLFGYTTDDGTPIRVSDTDLVRHGIIAGQTGMGKSVLGKSLMFQQIQRGGGLLFIDGKLDSDNIQEVYEYCVYCGRGKDFMVINPGQPEKSNTYNPILYGDPDEVASRIISLIPSTSDSAGADYYKQTANLALVVFISALQQESPTQIARWIEKAKKQKTPLEYLNTNRVKGKAYNFLDLALLTMNEGVLNNLMRNVSESDKDSLARKNLSIFLEQYAKEQNIDGNINKLNIDLKRLKEMLGGIAARMHQFGSGNFGQVLNSYAPEINMYEAIRDGKIIYAALPTMGKDVAAQNLGKMIVADLRTAVSWLQLNKNDRPKIPFMAFMDELSSYASDSLAVIFEQIRSAQVFLLPTIQSDSGLSNISEDFKERLMSNMELKIFFRLSSQLTAVNASELIGETTRIQHSTSTASGESASAQALQIGPNKSLSASENQGTSEREMVEPYVHQDLIKSLPKGECIILRSPKVWNVKVPMIELSQEIRDAIGPLKINHSKAYVEDKNSFGAMKKVDEYITEAQQSRIKLPKEKPQNKVPKGGEDASSNQTGSSKATAKPSAEHQSSASDF